MATEKKSAKSGKSDDQTEKKSAKSGKSDDATHESDDCTTKGLKSAKSAKSMPRGVLLLWSQIQ